MKMIPYSGMAIYWVVYLSLEHGVTLVLKVTLNATAYLAMGVLLMNAELVSPTYVMQDEKITAHVSVQYLDEQTNMTLLSQFQLILEKTDANWKIVG